MPSIEEEGFPKVNRRDRTTWPAGRCAHCTRDFPRSQRNHQYCSPGCRSAAFERRHRPTPAEVSCERCRCSFTRRRADQRFCSAACRIRAVNELRRRADPEGARERWRRWYRANRERFISYVREWKRLHPEKTAHYARRRRAARTGAGGAHSTDQVLMLLEAYGWRCAYCGGDGRLTIDHVVPLSRGGSDSIDNLVPACGSCNSSKHDRTLLEFEGARALADFIGGRVGARMSTRGAARRTTKGRA